MIFQATKTRLILRTDRQCSTRLAQMGRRALDRLRLWVRLGLRLVRELIHVIPAIGIYVRYTIRFVMLQKRDTDVVDADILQQVQRRKYGVIVTFRYP